ncbi:unnamed protein product [Adineta ricciae]|uniref:BOD1/SHG1 domain-containing protein n=1 Tax=Adineta ricciae TaxID=249248 RepID=A0A815EFW3_ADIRI|nr:unnamed protein product [Adineta ricciae]CAF1306154.1 unnamed protein product [Adineta ricciae]
MSDSYVLHDVMRKVKADGLFDSIRRDLISDIEQKQSYLDLKSQIESLMSTYLSEHKWSPALKKSDLRERARRHVETSNLIKDTLPTLVNEYMQSCQDQLIQPRLLSFVSDHLEHVYNSIGGTHVYRPPPSYTQSIPTPQEPVKTDPKPIPPVKKESIPSKPKVVVNKTSLTQTPNKASVVSKKKSIPPSKEVQTKEPKKTRVLSPTHSPSDLVDISPVSITVIEAEPTAISSSPSPPPPVVCIAPPLPHSSNTETPRKAKRSVENSKDESSTTTIKKKKIKTDDNLAKNASEQNAESTVPPMAANETDTRKLRSRRPNPKYSNEQYETEDLSILELSSSSSPPASTATKPKKLRPLKFSTSLEHENFDTPSSPPSSTPAPIETSLPVGDMSPEYGTLLPTENQSTEVPDERSRTPSPVATDTKKTTSPRRLRPRRANERTSAVENPNSTTEAPVRTSSKTRESNRQRTDQTLVLSTSDEVDASRVSAKTTRQSSNLDNDPPEDAVRSVSVPDILDLTTNETSTSPPQPPATAPVSKSFIWKPKISK